MPVSSIIRLCLLLVAHAVASWGLSSAASAQAPAGEQTGDRYAGLQFEAPSAATAAEPLLSYRRPDAATVNPLRPQPTPPPSAAVVGPSASVPLQFDARVEAADAAAAIDESDYAEPPLASTEDATATPLQSPATVVAPAPQQLAAALAPVQPFAAVEPTPVAPTTYDADDRRLAPPSGEGSREARSGSRSTLLPAAFSKLGSFSSAGMGLAIVVGLFLACACLLKKSGPKATGLLPAEAFAVLGRAQLSPQKFAHLLRLGNKLVLVAMTPDGVQPLAEVTEPAEVDRIAGLCVGGKSGGSSAEFQQVLAQLSREPARGFLGREGSASRRRS
jgi:flagellar biogenesis protein FliO